MLGLFEEIPDGEEALKQSSGARLLKVMMGTKKREERADNLEALKLARIARRQKRQEEDNQEDKQELSE
jgi:hypothetical protein